MCDQRKGRAAGMQGVAGRGKGDGVLEAGRDQVPGTLR